MSEASAPVLQLEGTIRGGPNDMIDSQECDENSSDCMDMMMNFGSESSLSEMMPNMESILTMPKTTPPPTISELFCAGSNSSPDDDFDPVAGQAWYSGGAMASRYLDGDGGLEEFEPAAKRSASGTPIGGGGQFQTKSKALGHYQDMNRELPSGAENKGPRPAQEIAERTPGANAEDLQDMRHKRKLADRGDIPRVSGLHLHPKNGALFSKHGRVPEESDEVMGDPMRVYRKTIMALGRENFFLKQQFGNANTQVVHLSRQLAILTEENQKLRSIVGKLGLGRSFGGADGLARLRGIDDSYLAPTAAGPRLEEERLLARAPRHQSPPAHGGGGMRGGFDMPSHQQGLSAQSLSHRRKVAEETLRHRRAMHMPAWQAQQHEEEEERWRWRQQQQQVQQAQAQQQHHQQQQQQQQSQAQQAQAHAQSQAQVTEDSACAMPERPRPQQPPRAAADREEEWKNKPAEAASNNNTAAPPTSNDKCNLKSPDNVVKSEPSGLEDAPSCKDGAERRGPADDGRQWAEKNQEEDGPPGTSGGVGGSTSSTPKGGGEGKDKGSKGKGLSAKDGQSQPRFWTKDEHARFLDAVRMYGYGNAREIAAYVQTRSITQVRTHAQKYILKLSKIGSQQGKDGKDGSEMDGSVRGLEDDDQSLSFLGGEKDDAAFFSPNPSQPLPVPPHAHGAAMAAARMHMDPYPYHPGAAPGGGSYVPGARGGEDDPSVAATWIENMELSSSYLDRDPNMSR